MSLYLGIDQGTSGSRALLLDETGQVRGYGYQPLARLHPRPGWVEQNPAAVVEGVRWAITAAIANAGCHPTEIAACGITCQRNTDFVWDAVTGEPLANAITWQDLRTAPLLDELRQWPQADEWRQRLGYTPGPFSSALHLAWRLQHQPAVAEAAHAGRLRIGFSASWLLAALGRPEGYRLEIGLAQQLGLFNFRAGDYWAAWLARLSISPEILPAPAPTIHPYGTLAVTSPTGASADVPVWAMLGDQQAALFGYDCRQPGQAECTHGTASFINICTGAEAPCHPDVINTYFAWLLGNQPTYCLEARTAATGSALRWMVEQARLINRVEDIGPLAASVPDAGEVIFVPPFSGLFSPVEDAGARGAVLGLRLGSSRAHIAHAFVEGVAYEIRAILERVQADSSTHISQLQVGGGVSASDDFCQIQADTLGLPIVRPIFTETTARAAALLAGLGSGLWNSPAELPPLPGQCAVFEPRLPTIQRDSGYERWLNAIGRMRG
ncbi:MAG: carbohydrate kinase [Chloroflexi bacterium]|nr:MAG: carbohydrate kinase [Chloroflexota bacterium]